MKIPSIWEEWLSGLKYESERIITPKDDIKYIIGEGVVQNTEHVLTEYRRISYEAHEGLVFWAGRQHGNTVIVSAVIAPETTSGPSRVTVPSESNVGVVLELSKNGLIHLGQVHSHPGTWVGHSNGDNEWASFKREGLLSLVVPTYGSKGMLPLTICGTHRFQSGEFIRLSKRYVRKHFSIEKMDYSFYDLREKMDERWI